MLIFTYYAFTYYVHVKDLCLKFDCFVRVYSLVYRGYTVLLMIIMYVLLEYIDLQSLSIMLALCLMFLATHYMLKIMLA